MREQARRGERTNGSKQQEHSHRCQSNRVILCHFCHCAIGCLGKELKDKKNQRVCFFFLMAPNIAVCLFRNKNNNYLYRMNNQKNYSNKSIIVLSYLSRRLPKVVPPINQWDNFHPISFQKEDIPAYQMYLILVQ